jgi:hypothetical protein
MNYRLSLPPTQRLLNSFLQLIDGICSARLLLEQLNDNLLFH